METTIKKKDNITTLIIGKEFANKVIPLIKGSKKSIDIIVFDWRWYPDQIGSAIQRLNNSIINQANKNRTVRALTNTHNTIKVLNQLKIKAKKIHSKRLLHTKLMIIDGKIAVLGSHNYTMSAFTINYEVSVIIYDPEAIKRLKQYFQNLWQ